LPLRGMSGGAAQRGEGNVSQGVFAALDV
jgi:hypothetical protein